MQLISTLIISEIRVGIASAMHLRVLCGCDCVAVAAWVCARGCVRVNVRVGVCARVHGAKIPAIFASVATSTNTPCVCARACACVCARVLHECARACVPQCARTDSARASAESISPAVPRLQRLYTCCNGYIDGTCCNGYIHAATAIYMPCLANGHKQAAYWLCRRYNGFVAALRILQRLYTGCVTAE